MTFIEALYGSQYYEIQKQGKDGNKGRKNGNIFLSAFTIVVIFIIIMICIKFIPGFNESITRSIRKIFGYSSGRSIGKLLAIPLFAIIYFIIAFTIGNEKNFRKVSEAFMELPDKEKKKANKIVLIPFFILLAMLLFLAISSL